MRESFANSVALKRLGTVDEMARAALYLCSDDASYVVGAELFADGGIADL